MNGFAREFTHDDNEYQVIRLAGSSVFRIYARIQGIDDDVTYGHSVDNVRGLSDLGAYELIRGYLIGEIDQEVYNARLLRV